MADNSKDVGLAQQQKKRNEEYNAYVKQVTPTHNLWANMGKAFLMICSIITDFPHLRMPVIILIRSDS